MRIANVFALFLRLGRLIYRVRCARGGELSLQEALKGYLAGGLLVFFEDLVITAIQLIVRKMGIALGDGDASVSRKLLGQF